MEIEITVSPARLTARQSGQFTLSEGRKSCQALIDVVVAHKATKVLVDALGVTGSPTVFERYQYAEFLAQLIQVPQNRGIASMAKYAWVMKSPLRDRNRLGENVAVNRGVSVKTFETIEEAQRWLDRVS